MTKEEPSADEFMNELREQAALTRAAIEGWDRSMKRERAILWLIAAALFYGFFLGLLIASTSINAILK